MLLAAGWANTRPDPEALYDLWFDPGEGTNRVDDPSRADVRADLRSRLDAWMRRTGDPLVDGPVLPAPGSVYNTVDQISPDEPTMPATSHSAGHTHRRRNDTHLPGPGVDDTPG